MVTCDFSDGGCNGGLVVPAVNSLITEGVVSEACMPYISGKGVNGLCTYRCSDISVPYQKYACKFNSMKILTTTDEIKDSLMTNGPLSVGFVVYDDFTDYQTGIYEQNSTTVAGGHAVTLIGWNEDGNSRLYWICQNQWGNTWGESGYFNIYAGQCGLDAIAVGCEPDLS